MATKQGVKSEVFLSQIFILFMGERHFLFFRDDWLMFIDSACALLYYNGKERDLGSGNTIVFNERNWRQRHSEAGIAKDSDVFGIYVDWWFRIVQNGLIGDCEVVKEFKTHGHFLSSCFIW